MAKSICLTNGDMRMATVWAALSTTLGCSLMILQRAAHSTGTNLSNTGWTVFILLVSRWFIAKLNGSSNNRSSEGLNRKIQHEIDFIRLCDLSVRHTMRNICISDYCKFNLTLDSKKTIHTRRNPTLRSWDKCSLGRPWWWRWGVLRWAQQAGLPSPLGGSQINRLRPACLSCAGRRADNQTGQSVDSRPKRVKRGRENTNRGW